MAIFSYKGFDTRGRAVTGVKDADNLRALRGVLKREGVLITEAKEGVVRLANGASASLSSFSPAALWQSYKERDTTDALQVSVVTRQLATLLKAGVPLSESLGALVEQIELPAFKRVLSDVRTQVNEGASLADALARHPKTFEDLYVNLIRAGEASGTLDTVLFRLTEFLDAQNRLRSKVISALTYPMVMAVIASGILTLLMVTVVPKVSTIFADSGKALPLNTQFLILASNIIGSWWGFVVLGVIIAMIVMFTRWKATPAGKARVDRITLKLPIVGELARQIAITRFAKTLATMLASGVPLLRALDIVKSILGNVVLMNVVEDAKESIKEGESIAAPLKRSGQFPPIVTHMIAVGERSGQLEQMLENIAFAYDQEIDQKMGRLTTLLEPLMILIMGGSVAFVVFSILMPIMQMNDFVN